MSNLMPKRGKKSQIIPSELENLLFDYGVGSLFCSNGRLLYKSDVWSEVSVKLNSSVKPLSLYLIVSQNRYNILSNLKNKFGILDEKIRSDSNELSSSDPDEAESDDTLDKSFNTSNNSSIGKINTFELDIPYESYCKMKPVVVEYGKSQRKYTVLKQGEWTNIIFDEFVKKFKLPCCFVFKRCKVFSATADNFLRLYGKCKEKSCQANLIGFAQKKPLEDQPLKLKIVTKDTRNMKHRYNMRFLNGNKRKVVAKELQNKYSHLWRRDEVNNHCEFGEVLPPNIYKSEVLRKAKQGYRDKILGIENTNPIISLIDIKHTLPYAGSIHLISADPVMVHYWTPTQMMVYKDASKDVLKTCRLCIDATGQLVKPIYRTSQRLKSSHIFLYAIVLHDGSMQTPVCQMLSESQDMSTITYWLSQWIRLGAPIPHEVVCDYSYALIGAICRAFSNGMSKNQYCDMSLQIMQNKSIICSPKIYIRLDIAHFTKMVCRWKCLSKKPFKEFFVRSILLLFQSENLSDFENIFVKIVVIACSKTDGPIKGCGRNSLSPAETFRESLIGIIKDKNVVNTDESDENDECVTKIKFEDQMENVMDDVNQVHGYLNSLSTTIDNYLLINGDRLNAYYVPELRNQLFRIAKDFPLWTNIMNKFYNSPFETATSAPVENYIGDIKREFKRKPQTVDRFVASHLKSIEGILKISKSQQMYKLTQNIEKEVRTSSDEDSNSQDKNRFNMYERTFENNSSDEECVYEKNITICCDKISLPENLDKDSDKEKIENVDTVLSEQSSSSDEMNDKVKDYNEIENWKNLADKSTQKNIKVKNDKKRLAKYKDKCPEIRQNLNLSRLRSSKNPVIINGNICQPVKIDKKQIIIYKTCPFDSLLVCTYISYVEFNSYKILTDEMSSSNKFLDLCKTMGTAKVNSNIYTKRALILLDIFSDQIKPISDRVNTLDVKCNINFLTEKMLPNVPSIVERHNCANCNFSQKFESAVISIDAIQYNDNMYLDKFSILNYELDSHLTEKVKICLKCNQKSKIIQKEVQKHLWIDLDWLNKSMMNQFLKSISANDLPDEIHLQNKRYCISAIISFIGIENVNTIGHYVAFCKRSRGYWELHNDLAKDIRRFNKIPNDINAHQVLYIECQ